MTINIEIELNVGDRFLWHVTDEQWTVIDVDDDDAFATLANPNWTTQRYFTQNELQGLMDCGVVDYLGTLQKETSE